MPFVMTETVGSRQNNIDVDSLFVFGTSFGLGSFTRTRITIASIKIIYILYIPYMYGMHPKNK